MSHNKREDGNEIWVYKVVLLYPTSVHSNKAKVTRCELATEAAGQFYSTLFNSTEADLRSIHHAVGWDPTIMVIERPIVKGEDHSENCGNQVNSQQRDGPPHDNNRGAGTARRTRRERQNY